MSMISCLAVAMQLQPPWEIMVGHGWLLRFSLSCLSKKELRICGLCGLCGCDFSFLLSELLYLVLISKWHLLVY